MIGTPTRIDVTAFGADPTGSRDSAPAIREAFAAAGAAKGAVIIEFPHGRYDIWPESAEQRELYVSNTVGADQRYRVKTLGILIENTKDLSVIGNDSTLIYHGRQTTIAIVDSERVRLTGLTIDFAVPTVIDATVVETGVVAGHAFRILSVPLTNPFRIDGNSIVWHGEVSPETGVEYWSGSNELVYTQVHDPRAQRTFRIDRNPLFDDVANITDIGGNRIRIDYTTASQPNDAGLIYQMRPTTRDHPGILILESADVTLERLTVHFLHGFGVVAQLSRDVTIDGVTFQTPGGSGRSTAGFADFIQFSGVAGDAIVRDCTFDGPHDDPINIHGTYLRVVGQPSANSLELRYVHHETAGFPHFFPGDEVEIVDERTLLPVTKTLTVASVDGPSGRDRAHDLLRMTVEFTEAIPTAVATAQSAGHLVVENLTFTPRVTITGNRFVNVPTRGILVTTRRPVLIEKNRFEGMTMASIYISADTEEWFESGPVRDVMIRDNEFIRPSSPVILIEPTNSVLDADKPVHRNISVVGNRFHTQDATLLDARSVSHLRFERNRIDIEPNADRTPRPTFRLRGTSEVFIEDNTFPPDYTTTVASE